jgi:hypothetical protein
MFGSVEVYFMQALGGIQPHPAAKGFDKVTDCKFAASICCLNRLLICCSTDFWPLSGVDQAAPASIPSIVWCHVPLHPWNDLGALEMAGGPDRERCW